MKTNTPQATKIANSLSQDSINILLSRKCESYCKGSDELVAKGVWTNDGALTTLGYDVQGRVKTSQDVLDALGAFEAQANA